MAKRFIDTALFDDEWFSALSSDGKIAWIYCITKCDHAGIIKINERLFTFQTGIDSWQTVSEELGKTLVRVNEQFVYFIPKFIRFQYPNFPQSSVKQQEGAIKILRQYGLWDEEINSYLTLIKELPNSYDNVSGNDTGFGIVNNTQAKKTNDDYARDYRESHTQTENGIRILRNNKLREDQENLFHLLECFVTAQNHANIQKQSFSEFSKHFGNWIGTNGAKYGLKKRAF